MRYRTSGALIAIAVGVVFADTALAQAPAAQRARACSLLPKEEVKKHLPWEAMLDNIAPEETPIGAAGSSCDYPGVTIQVLPATSRIMEIARAKSGVETVSGIGTEALFHVNPSGYAELYVRTARQVLTIQASAPNGVAQVKPGVLSLARVLVGKL